MLEVGDSQQETQMHKKTGKRSEAFAKYEQTVLAEMSRRAGTGAGQRTLK